MLPPSQFKRLAGGTETIHLIQGQTLYEPRKPIEYAYFPLNVVLSLVVRMDDGTGVEVATIGNEGFVGLPLLLGAKASKEHVFVQVAGDALRMPAKSFVQEIGPNGAFNGILRRYAQGYLMQVAQTAACNGLHPIEQRLCRWVLMTQDRIGLDTLPLTQEFLALMLGVRRASVALAAGTLQNAGFIKYSRGKIRILDRPALEETCCECYRSVRDEFERLL